MKQIIFFILFSLFFSCGDDNKNSSNTIQVKPKLSLVKQHIPIEPVSVVYEKEVKDWQDLKTVTLFIKKFEKVSPNEALSNALELRDLIASLKDNQIPEILDTPAFHARLNVLYNEALRLADITLIPSITSEEVNYQVQKTIYAFSAVNSKINIVFEKKRFEDAIDIDVDFIGIDSTKMDSITLKTINKKKKEEELIKNKK